MVEICLRYLGIEFEANKLVWVAAEKDEAGEISILAGGRIGLDETRSPIALRAFMHQVRDVLKVQMPKSVCVKAKPENGQMRAGAPSLKMEAILLAVCDCEVAFVTPQKIKKVENREGLKVYQQDAWKAIAVVHG
jgi:hypothetical protein